jgi:hypothetical protein
MTVDQVDEGDPFHRRAGSPSSARPAQAPTRSGRRGDAETGHG